MSEQTTITLTLPLYDTRQTFEEKRQKLIEEILELLLEVNKAEKDIDIVHAASELMDVNQVFAGMIHAYFKDRTNSCVGSLTRYYFLDTNMQHKEKMNLYSIERRWDVVHE